MFTSTAPRLWSEVYCCPPAVRHLKRGWTTSSVATDQRTHFRITSSCTETPWANEVSGDWTVQSQRWRFEVGQDVRSQQTDVNMLGHCLYLKDLLWGGPVKTRLVSPVNGGIPCLALLLSVSLGTHTPVRFPFNPTEVYGEIWVFQHKDTKHHHPVDLHLFRGPICY